MTRFTAEEQCGHWNSAIVDDLLGDAEFLTAAEALHLQAARTCFDGDLPTTDGLGILAVGIEIGMSICVDFQLWFFVDRDGQTGHSAAPGRFTVSTADGDSDRFSASFGCGLRGPNGGFWYPRNDSNDGRFDQPPSDPCDWAFWHAKTYGEGSLSSWIANRNGGGG